jgi:hypothetical protein
MLHLDTTFSDGVSNTNPYLGVFEVMLQFDPEGLPGKVVYSADYTYCLFLQFLTDCTFRSSGS